MDVIGRRFESDRSSLTLTWELANGRNITLSTNLAKREAPPLQVAHRFQGLFDIPGFHFTPVSLKIDDWVEFDVWEAAGRALEIAGQAIQWYLGDWLTHGERKWGEKYAQVVDAHKKTGIPINTLRDYQRVAENVKVDVRTSGLDWSVHRAVASLPAARQKEILQRASKDKEKWTKRAVERYVETGLEPGEKSGINASALAQATNSAKVRPGEDLKLVADRAMIGFLEETRKEVCELKTKCPRPKFVTDVLDSWLDELDDYLEQLTLSVLKDKVIQAWRQGHRQEAQIAKITGIPPGEIHGVMKAYERDGLFEKINRQKTKMAKGTPPWIWHLKGEPVGTDYQTNTTSIYKMGESE